MPTEPTDGGSLLYGYLDTAASSTRFDDTVLAISEGSYRAELRPYRFGAVTACEISSDQDVQVRPWRPAGRAGAERLVGAVVLAGRGRLEQDGRATDLGPGELVLYTGKRPFRLGVQGPYRYFVVNFGALPATEARGCRLVTANREITGSPGARVLAAMLVELAEQAPGLGPLASREMGEHAGGLLRTVLRGSSPGAPLPAASSEDGECVFERILDYIDGHLGADLAPEAIAHAHHISVRYLHKLFQLRGDTVGAHVRRRRLDRIRRDLADPGLAHRPASVVAHRWGIAEASHFSKLFRAEFGVSPREFRSAALGHPDSPAGHRRRPSTA